MGSRGASEQTEREFSLLSSGESSVGADVGGMATGSIDEAGSAMPSTDTIARIHGGGSGKKKVRFEAAPRIIPRRVVSRTLGRRELPVDRNRGAT